MNKTMSFAGVHMAVAFLVGWAMTGNPWVGGALALVEPACNTVAYHFHEKLWKRIEARTPPRRLQPECASAGDSGALAPHAMHLAPPPARARNCIPRQTNNAGNLSRIAQSHPLRPALLSSSLS